MDVDRWICTASILLAAACGSASTSEFESPSRDRPNEAVPVDPPQLIAPDAAVGTVRPTVACKGALPLPASSAALVNVPGGPPASGPDDIPRGAYVLQELRMYTGSGGATGTSPDVARGAAVVDETSIAFHTEGANAATVTYSVLRYEPAGVVLEKVCGDGPSSLTVEYIASVVGGPSGEVAQLELVWSRSPQATLTSVYRLPL